MVERVMTLSRGWSLSARGIGKALETIIQDGIARLGGTFGAVNKEAGSQQQSVLFCAELQVSRQAWYDSGLVSAESALDRFTDGGTKTYWREPEGRGSRLAAGSVMEIHAQGKDRWPSLRQHWESEHQAVSLVIHVRGELEVSETQDEIILHEETFEPGSVADIPWYGGGAFNDDKPEGPWTGWPAAFFYVPEFELVEDGSTIRLLVRMLSPVANDDGHQVKEVLQRFLRWFGKADGHPNETADAKRRQVGLDEEDGADIRIESWYQDAVAQTAAEIQNGAYHKLVLARHRTLHAPRVYHPGRVIRELMVHYPDSFVFAVCFNFSCFVGASPERLVRVENHVANVDCLAGTTARGASDQEDAKLADALLHSAKDRKEHQVVLEWIEQRLSDFSSEITHPNQPQIRKLANVQHLHTPIEAVLDSGVTMLDLVAELHPTPAVAGTPRDTAISLIRERELMDRGWYAGCLGILQGNGDGEMCVAIRSALIVGRTATLYAGAGIMGDSNPASEWRETELKLRPMEGALTASGRASAGNTPFEEELD